MSKSTPVFVAGQVVGREERLEILGRGSKYYCVREIPFGTKSIRRISEIDSHYQRAKPAARK